MTVRARVRLLAALGTACAAAVLALPATAATTSPSPTPSPSPAASDAGRPPRVVDRTVSDDRVQEASGLVASRTLDGVLWTFNDSGGDPDLFGVGRDGSVVARLRVKGVENRDWESAAPVRLADRSPAVAIGDTGDNRASRDHVTIHVVREPTTTGTTKAAPERTITLTYPDGPVDAEAIFCDPRTNRLYVVTKGLLGGRLYAVPREAWPGGRSTGRRVEAELTYLARVPLVLVTDAAAMPDGRVALRTYGELAMMPPVPADDEVWPPLATTLLPRQGQGESIALARSRTSFFLGTEGRRKPILRFTPPAAVMAAQPEGVPPAPSGSGRPTAKAGGGATSGAPGSAGADVLLYAGAGLVGLLATGAAVSLARRRR